MILCVCLSPAVDVTYHVDHLHPGGTTRVGTVTEQPAGDAVVAGLARGLLRDPLAVESPEKVLRDAVALSAAAVLSPQARDVDPAHHVAQLPGVVVRALDGAR